MDKYFNSEEVLRAVKNINYTDGMCTLIYRGLEQARTDIFNTDTGARPDIQDVAIVLTDGETNPGRMDPYSLPYAKTLTRQEANKLKMNGVNVFGIGVGPRVDHAEMIGISSGERNYLRVGDIDDLNVKQLLDNVIGKICEKPEKIVQPPVRNNSCTNSPADIFFVVDKSSSLRSMENFNKELSFIARFVDGFNVGPGPRDSRVGLLTFSTDAKFEFGLNDYRTKTELQNALLNVKYTMGDTYTHKALNMMLEQGFRFQTRPGVPRIGIIMTDGHSTDPYSLNIAVEEVRKSGIDVFAIGFGDYGLSELNLMATDPDSTHVFVVDDVTSLDYVRDDLYLQVCDTIGVKSNYTLTFGLENNRIP
ncbi:hypothetical protein FSP39_016752 [Pinctada imbricata]|uniref:VWFA domain-containing protein n=1 Tax=Pinctada imbricata TaxID=66713 RepID=A0AA89C948_PINIB|nr:hypothetical protein FSP39_016752 [Pinctada imbricata]